MENGNGDRLAVADTSVNVSESAERGEWWKIFGSLALYLVCGMAAILVLVGFTSFINNASNNSDVLYAEIDVWEQECVLPVGERALECETITQWWDRGDVWLGAQYVYPSDWREPKCGLVFDAGRAGRGGFGAEAEAENILTHLSERHCGGRLLGVPLSELAEIAVNQTQPEYNAHQTYWRAALEGITDWYLRVVPEPNLLSEVDDAFSFDTDTALDNSPYVRVERLRS